MCGMDRDGGVGQLTNELLAGVIGGVHPTRGPATNTAREAVAGQREQIKGWRDQGLTLTKAHAASGAAACGLVSNAAPRPCRSAPSRIVPWFTIITHVPYRGSTSVSDVHMPNLLRHMVGRFAKITIVPLLPPKAANLLQCRGDYVANAAYFQQAEGQFEGQWNETIWPLIKDFDFDTVLELSPGAGRNTEKLSTLTSGLIAVDYNQHALDLTRARVGTSRGECEISYHRNNGSDLRMVPDASVTAIYCWDSAVHFDKSVVLTYISEFARVLKRGGSGFFHHSDLGDRAHKIISRNPHSRSNVSKELVARACQANGLTVTLQHPVPCSDPPIIDCATIFRKDG